MGFPDNSKANMEHNALVVVQVPPYLCVYFRFFYEPSLLVAIFHVKLSSKNLEDVLRISFPI